MKRMNQFLRYSSVALLAASVNAYAAVPQDVKTSLDASKADGTEMGWYVIGVLAALFVFGIVRKVIR